MIQNLQGISKEVADIIDAGLQDWTDKTIGQACRNLAKSKGLSDNVVSNIKTVKTGYCDVDVVFDYAVGGKPVGMWLEKGFGSGGYDIYPRHAKFLHWVTSENAGVFFPQFNRVSGTLEMHHYALHVRHPGFAGYHFMEDGYKQGYPDLMRVIESHLEMKLS